ncbi:MAG TPA: rhomboid family intramembrane serine protease [Bryobacterales bacterium]|jgi:membrane associated rhomboid family serine protease|nr:rhomboid family intramembrane serine protease [Bryobacterales bacterium]
MIPLRDNIPSRRYPVVNVTLIILNVVVFLYQLMLGPDLESFVRTYAVVPYRYFHAVYVTSHGLRPVTTADLLIPLVTSMFLHGGWLHLIGNMWYLWIFGDNVEDRLGHGRYLIFYLLCGITAALAHIWFNAGSRLPSLGASGAIAGVLSAYLISFPRARVLVLVPLFFFFPIVEIPALFFLGFWFLQQFFYGAASLGVPAYQTGGVAWWAHVGGFVSGAILLWAFAPKGRYRPASYSVWG